ncbi:hypothetical protein HNR46_001292 [Haloferula luteola]|uniref:LTD domain-containing protein n=1 Tax=Haloferula luteola TaxID=595692 RepID=A0A840V8K4_9BACT|nr:lamin tail domain-containing protein [Haloferula luteola]MBB5351058.1 hypothetical protein [Haloferula luteola]
MSMRFPFVLAGAFAWVSSVSQGALVISEVLYNEVGSNTAGEFIELFNNGAFSIDLTGYRIGDEETSGDSSATESMYAFPSGSTIAAGQTIVIGIGSGTFFANYGFRPDYEIIDDSASVPNLVLDSTWDPDGGVINLSNSNDQLLLLDDAGQVVDMVSWGNTFAMNPALDASAESDGQSYHRIDPFVDTDTAADWALTTGASLSTPGVVPEPGVTVLGIAGLGLLVRRRR